MNDITSTVSLLLQERIFGMNEFNTEFLLAPKIKFTCFAFARNENFLRKRILKKKGLQNWRDAARRCLELRRHRGVVIIVRLSEFRGHNHRP